MPTRRPESSLISWNSPRYTARPGSSGTMPHTDVTTDGTPSRLPTASLRNPTTRAATALATAGPAPSSSAPRYTSQAVPPTTAASVIARPPA